LEEYKLKKVEKVKEIYEINSFIVCFSSIARST